MKFVRTSAFGMLLCFRLTCFFLPTPSRCPSTTATGIGEGLRTPLISQLQEKIGGTLHLSTEINKWMIIVESALAFELFRRVNFAADPVESVIAAVHSLLRSRVPKQPAPSL